MRPERARIAVAVAVAGLVAASAGIGRAAEGQRPALAGSARALGIEVFADRANSLPVSNYANPIAAFAEASLNEATPDSRSRASVMYPGELVLGLPGLLGVAGVPLPPGVGWPSYAAASYPGTPESTGIGGSSSSGALAVGVGEERAAAASDRSDAAASGQRAAIDGVISVAGIDVSAATGGGGARARSVLHDVSIGDGAVVADRIMVSAGAGESKGEKVTIEGLRTPSGVVLAVGPDGFSVVDGRVPTEVQKVVLDGVREAMAERGITVTGPTHGSTANGLHYATALSLVWRTTDPQGSVIETRVVLGGASAATRLVNDDAPGADGPSPDGGTPLSPSPVQPAAVASAGGSTRPVDVATAPLGPGTAAGGTRVLSATQALSLGSGGPFIAGLAVLAVFAATARRTLRRRFGA